MKRTGKPCTNLGLSPRDPFSWASIISASPPYPGSSLPSSPLLCFQPPRSPSPAWAAVPPRPPLPRWQFRSALPAPGSGAHSACSSHPHSCCKRRKGGRRADGSETVDLVSARNSRETLPWCSRPSLQLFLCAAGPRALVPQAVPAFPDVWALAISIPLASPHLELPCIPFNYHLLPPVLSLCSPCSHCSSGWHWGRPRSSKAQSPSTTVG